MFEINKKFTQEEVKEIEMTIALLAMIGAGNAPITQEEFDAWCDEAIEEYYANIEKAKALAQKKIDKKIAKAKEMGMTVEEYEEYERKKKNYKRHLAEVRKCEKEIERLKREIEYHKEKAEYWKV